MAIQPIDLQTMYSQLSNVSKAMSGTQQAQLTEAMQQQSNIQKNIENTERVQEASNEKADANEVNQNGSGSSSFSGGQKKKRDDVTPGTHEQAPHKSRYSHLGTIIDITR